jgi:Ser/Thr protein kinase RdoA (MazF antagonist)
MVDAFADAKGLPHGGEVNGVADSSSDEVMRKLLKPLLTQAQVLEILTMSYVSDVPVAQSTDAGGVEILQQLESYDDSNWKVAINGDLHLLKIHNGVESREFLELYEAAGGDYYKLGFAGSAIHFQNAILETLRQNNIPTSVPVPAVRQLGSKELEDSSSPVSIHTLPVISEAHTPTRLVVRLFKWVEGRCMSDMPMLPLEALADAGRMLGRMDAALDQLCPENPLTLHRKADFGRRHSLPLSGSLMAASSLIQNHLADVSLMSAARRYHQWDGKNTADLRKFVHCIPDENRRAMVESVLDAFDIEFTQNPEYVSSLRKGVIMGDFNDANILLDRDWNVCGVIDFGDSVERSVELDVAVPHMDCAFACHTRVSRVLCTMPIMLSVVAR